MKAEQAGNNDAAADAAAAEWGAPVADAWGAAPAVEGDAAAAPAAEGDKPEEGRRREREVEEEDNTLTYEQYLAQQKEAADAAIPKLEGVRQANEGAGDDLWKDAVPKEKKNEEEDAYFVGKVGSSAQVGRVRRDD